MMKKLLLLGLCITYAALAHATTYYVSYRGQDRHSGTSPDQAWRTLEKVNAMMKSFQPGDAILFRRGDRFAGQLVITASGAAGQPITFGAYGSGDRPIINGFQRLTRWTAVGNRIWKADYDSPHGRVYNLVINHQFQSIGRYPNIDEAHGGYLPISGGNGRSQLISEELQGGSWTGGDAVVRSRRWILDRVPIVHHQDIRLTLAHSTTYDAINGFGFFIVNHRNTLDREGEWAYHHAERTLYLRSQRDPNTRAILTAHVAELIRMHWVQYINVQHLDLWGAAKDALVISYSKHITVSNCRFYGSGQNGATVKYSERTFLLNNQFEHTNNNGIQVAQGKFTEIGSNTFMQTGMVPGMGASGNHAYCAIRGKSQHFNVHHNRIDQVGYNGITFVGDYINIQYNHVTNFCQLKDDGAGIYAGNHEPHPYRLIQIKNNIVGNEEAPPVALGWGTNLSHLAHVNGIYLDNHVNGANIENNTVYGCQNYGIYFHNVYNNLLKNNTLYNNWRALGMSHDTRGVDTKGVDAPIRDNILQNNVLFARQASQELLHFRSIKEDYFEFGTIDQNYYYSPLKYERVVRATDRNYRSQLYSITQWQKASPYDQRSLVGTERWPTHVINRYLSDNLLPNATFTENVRGWQGWSQDGDGAIHHTKEAIDGGSLTMAFATKGAGSYLSVSTNSGIGRLRQGEQFMLRYSLQSDGEGATLDTKLVNKGGPYRVLSNIHYIAADMKRQEIEQFFAVEHTAQEGKLNISLPKNDHPVHLDNVSLRKVATQPVDYQQYVQFLTNPSRRRISRSLPGGRWKSARGQAFRGSVKLEPFQSMILLRDEDELASLRASRQAHIEADLSVASSEKTNPSEDVLPKGLSQSTLHLYPNPLTEGPLTVDMGVSTGLAQVQVYDSKGVLLVSRPAEGQKRVTFSSEELGSGLRLIKVITPGRTMTGKVVVR